MNAELKLESQAATIRRLKARNQKLHGIVESQSLLLAEASDILKDLEMPEVMSGYVKDLRERMEECV